MASLVARDGRCFLVLELVRQHQAELVVRQGQGRVAAGPAEEFVEGFVLGSQPLDELEECVRELGIELSAAPIPDFLQRLVHRPRFRERASVGEGVEGGASYIDRCCW